ncbi:DUF1624 domain-containing protein, partial [bacterium]|nr:DUF1624 domain-containing protein [bacterium]
MNGQPTRQRDIDFWKGVGCLVMCLSHPLRVQIAIEQAGGPAMSPAVRLFIQTIEPFAVTFFMCSGLNAWTSATRRGRLSARNDIFQIGAALALFVLGFTYNLSLGVFHMGVSDIFQGIALSAIAVYLVARISPTVGAYGIAAGVVFLVAGLVHSRLSPEHFDLYALPTRFFFAHFAFFPWAGFALFGVFLYLLDDGGR